MLFWRSGRGLFGELRQHRHLNEWMGRLEQGGVVGLQRITRSVIINTGRTRISNLTEATNICGYTNLGTASKISNY